MKASVIALLLAMIVFPVAGQNIDSLTPTDRELLVSAVQLVDNGMSEAALPDFDYLAKKYPDNYIVQYERLYNLYKLERYDEVIKDGKGLLKSKEASELTYQLVGNAYDMTGKRDKALSIYADGIKRFPDSGALYLESGNIYLAEEEYSKAMDKYSAGIEAAPNFASNYYRGAQIYLSTEEMKVWGLIYAETEVLLAPNRDDRHQEMAQLMLDCLKESIHIDRTDSVAVSVSLVPNRGVTFDSKTNIAYLAFPGVYEGAIAQPINKIFFSGAPLDWSLPQLMEIRKGLVETYYSVTDNIYGSSMYLLEFQKAIIDAGHWDAYNYFLFMFSFPDVFEKWYEDHSDDFTAFVNWFNNDRFILDGERSVSPRNIFRTYRPIGMEGWLNIQSRLLLDTGQKEN